MYYLSTILGFVFPVIISYSMTCFLLDDMFYIHAHSFVIKKYRRNLSAFSSLYVILIYRTLSIKPHSGSI